MFLRFLKFEKNIGLLVIYWLENRDQQSTTKNFKCHKPCFCFLLSICLYDMPLVILHLKTSNRLYLFWWNRCSYCQWVSVLPLFRSFFSSLYLHGVPSEQNLWTSLKRISILILPQFISCAFRDLWCRIKVANISFHFGCCSLWHPTLAFDPQAARHPGGGHCA